MVHQKWGIGLVLFTTGISHFLLHFSPISRVVIWTNILLIQPLVQAYKDWRNDKIFYSSSSMHANMPQVLNVISRLVNFNLPLKMSLKSFSLPQDSSPLEPYRTLFPRLYIWDLVQVREDTTISNSHSITMSKWSETIILREPTVST